MIGASQLRETWHVTKPAVTSRQGLVASQHYAASEVGARVLSDGGNALDAAVAASLMIGTVEPWMSGLGGGAFLLYYDAAEATVHAVDCGMRSGHTVDPAEYALENGTDDDLFAWPAVHEQRNVHGPLSIAVPGYLAGIAQALERFGTRSLAELIAPAVDSARRGMDVDWFATLKIAAAQGLLARYRDSARCYLPEGVVPAGEWGGPIPRISLGALADTLQHIAHAGWRDFYHGDIAGSIANDARTYGAHLTTQDLARYQSRLGIAPSMRYRNATIHTAPGLSAGPTLAAVFDALQRSFTPGAHPDAAAYCAYADAMLRAYEDRLSSMGDCDESLAPSCTTHLSVVDRHGNMVALTQTLLSVFGSKVLFPGTGVLMNNGMMWFDPRPGRPNSLAPDKRPLSNMCPVIAERGDGTTLAAGASGGRRIMAAVMQLVSFVCDFEMNVDRAVHQPRIDVSGTPWVTAFDDLAPEITQSLARNHEVRVEPNAVYPALFACPNIVCRSGANGEASGGAFIMSPWAMVAAAQ